MAVWLKYFTKGRVFFSYLLRETVVSVFNIQTPLFLVLLPSMVFIAKYLVYSLEDKKHIVKYLGKGTKKEQKKRKGQGTFVF